MRKVLSSRICASWKNGHTANNSYLVRQTHCKTDLSKDCKRLRVLIFVHVLQLGAAAPPKPFRYFEHSKTNGCKKLVRSDLRPRFANGAQSPPAVS